MEHFEYITRGVCSRKIEFDIDNNIIRNIRFFGGCNGNTQGVCRLADGMEAQKVIDLLKGINCNGRGTSCPDQLATAIDKAINN